MADLRIAAILAVALFAFSGFADASCQITSRDQWNARDMPVKLTVEKPAVRVIVREVRGLQCASRRECTRFMKYLQDNAIIFGKTDIGCNFVVGGDGYIYEGTGWTNDAAQAYRKEFTDTKSYVICAAGIFSWKIASTRQKTGLNQIIQCAVTANNLASNYKLMAEQDISGFKDKKMNDKLYTVVKSLKNYNPTY